MIKYFSLSAIGLLRSLTMHSSRANKDSPRSFPGMIYFIMLLFVVILTTRVSAAPGTSLEEAFAEQAFQQQDYTKALRLFHALDSFRAAFGAGAIAYYRHDWTTAKENFTRAVERAADDKQRASAWYNIGNTLARQGDRVAAIAAYRTTLQLLPTHARAQRNLNLLRQEKRSLAPSTAPDTRKAEATENTSADNSLPDSRQLATALARWQQTFSLPDKHQRQNGPHTVDNELLALARYRRSLLSEDVSQLVRQRIAEEEARRPSFVPIMPAW